MLEWFIIVVLYTSNPAVEGQPIFMFNKPFETREECMIELQTNANTYFLKGSLAFGGIPPKMANCVDTNAIDSKTMEARNHPGLYFIGEVVDVTGHLGGYNFQWAWSSGYSAGLVA